MSQRGTVVVTGAARGQGASHATMLAQDDYAVIATDVLDAEGERFALEQRAAGLDVTYRHLDVGDEQQWDHLAAELAGTGVHGLVNNAGVLRFGLLQDTTLETWQLHERVNSHGPFLAVRALAPLLRDGGGSIVNVSSTAALVASSGYAAYAASKAALIALTRVAAVELAPDVRVNVICPGGVSTPMNDDEPPGGTSSTCLMGRRAHPHEISPLIRYLLSDDSSFVTGSVLTIDGGLTAV